MIIITIVTIEYSLRIRMLHNYYNIFVNSPGLDRVNIKTISLLYYMSTVNCSTNTAFLEGFVIKILVILLSDTCRY